MNEASDAIEEIMKSMEAVSADMALLDDRISRLAVAAGIVERSIEDTRILVEAAREVMGVAE